MPLTQNLPETLNLPASQPVFSWSHLSKQLPALATYSRNSATASHINETGTLVSDAANVARFEKQGLRIEQAATNLMLNSRKVSNASYGKTRTTVVTDAIVGLDSVTLIDKLVEDATANNTHFCYQQRVISIGKLYFEAYLKDADRRYAIVEISAAAGSTESMRVGVDLQNGTITPITKSGGTTLEEAYITDLGNGRYKVSIAGLLGAGTTFRGTIYTCNTFSTAYSYSGDGVSGFYVLDTQLTTTGFSSLIPNATGANITRALDLHTIPTASFLRSDAFSALWVFNGQAADTVTYFSIHDGTANERIYLESVSGALTLKIVDGGVEQCSLSLGTVVTGTEYRVAFAATLNDVAACINGGAVVTDASVTLPTVTTISYCNYAGAQQANTHFKDIRVWAGRLTNRELQGLTL